MPTTEDVDRIGEDLFTAYNAQGPNPWKTYDGRDVPKWNELGEQVTAKWQAVARRALELFVYTEKTS